MPKLALLIITFNEEANMQACINSASFVDEIVVVDSGSTDSTVAIAEDLGAKVYYHKMLIKSRDFSKKFQKILKYIFLMP